jgi:hypothetical protein
VIDEGHVDSGEEQQQVDLHDRHLSQGYNDYESEDPPDQHYHNPVDPHKVIALVLNTFD